MNKFFIFVNGYILFVCFKKKKNLNIWYYKYFGSLINMDMIMLLYFFL